jgi:hypothetical protein
MGPRIIPAGNLQVPLITSLPPNNRTEELEAVSQIVELLRSRKNPVIVVDGGKFFGSKTVVPTEPCANSRCGAK